MVFITSIDILDTGFLSVSNRTSQLSTASRANAGSAFRLKGVELDYGTSSNVDDETYTAEFDDIDVPVVSVNPDSIKLTIYLNRSSTAANTGVWDTGDMQYLLALSQIPKTKGFKALYYPVDVASAATTRRHSSQPTYYLGRTDTVESQGDIDITIATSETATASSKDLTDIKYVPVRFKTFDMSADSTGGIKVTLEGVRTA